MNELANTTSNVLSTIDPSVYQALKNSIYPGAKDESISMVLSYCKAAKLDPLLKPVHIVPMWIKDSKTQKGEMRDVVMPGINLYRIQASRSGCAGISEPEFGEDVIECLSGADVTYPKWCKIIVKRIIAGKVVEFSAKEYWKENYATAGKDSQAPNAMWKKRPYGQLAKCTEAQALRKAFPEIGAMPTAEEMEGKAISSDEADFISKGGNASIPGKGIQGLKEKLGLIETPVEAEFDEVTGEISEAESCPFVTVEEVKDLIDKAVNLEDLLKIRSIAKSLNDEEKKSLHVFYREKEKQLSF